MAFRDKTALKRAVDYLENLITQQGTNMASALDQVVIDITAALTAAQTQEQANLAAIAANIAEVDTAIVNLNNLVAQLASAPADVAALQALVPQIQQGAAAVSAANANLQTATTNLQAADAAAAPPAPGPAP